MRGADLEAVPPELMEDQRKGEEQPEETEQPCGIGMTMQPIGHIGLQSGQESSSSSFERMGLGEVDAPMTPAFGGLPIADLRSPDGFGRTSRQMAEK